MRLLLQLAVLALLLAIGYAVSLGTAFVIGVVLHLFNSNVDVVGNAYVFAQYSLIIGLITAAVGLITGRLHVLVDDSE